MDYYEARRLAETMGKQGVEVMHLVAVLATAFGHEVLENFEHRGIGLCVRRKAEADTTLSDVVWSVEEAQDWQVNTW